jgi:hypothetical protein
MNPPMINIPYPLVALLFAYRLRRPDPFGKLQGERLASP